ncbi:hypothetical protein SAMN06298214_1841 [Bacteroidales bacterium WCE2004]|nr:hypothetical protein SAMN06298214_1841 [Bacteroidales bacterium WCE2004]
MKKSLAFVLVLLASCILRAQECSTAWPYLYPSFTEGSVVLNNGTKSQQTLNVHILHGALHYIDNGIVKEAQLADVLYAQIGDDRYMNVDGQMMKIVASSELGFVALQSLGDFERLLEGSGAYGTSNTTSATRKLSSLEIAGINQNHMEMWESRHGGERVNLVNKYFVVVPGGFFEASRRGIESGLDEAGKAAFKSWLKSHKIKWKEPESLLTLVDFLNQ